MKGDVETKLHAGEGKNVHIEPLKVKKNHYGPIKKKVQLMGILNCTPDSFFDGGSYSNPEKAIDHGRKLLSEGADIIDIGGESTRPGATSVSEEEELRRVLPIVSALAGAPLSIDTCKPKVAEAALLHGASLINDVTGFSNPSMRRLAASAGVPICVVHMQNTPQTMQNSPQYPLGVVTEVKQWLEKRIELLLKEGVHEENIIVDPGIGFGKTVEDNLMIVSHLSELKSLGFPILMGLSRKSFLQKILGKPATEVLSTTIALNTMSILEGASYIRVHDVGAHRDVINVLDRLACSSS